MKKKIICLILCLAMCASLALSLTACGEPQNSKPDALVIMTENLDGLFNPFYSTSAADGTIVAMTQIGMLTSKYVNEKAEVAFGEDQATVALDFESKYNEALDETVYTFVIKNGILFADGEPLTMEDVLFNLYLYLDPVYAGSATMYSTDIKGLNAYRTQTPGADSDDDQFTLINATAAGRADNRTNTLIQLFWKTGESSSSTGSKTYYADVDMMKAAIMSATTKLNDGYKSAITTPDKYAEVTNSQLLKDYEYFLEKYMEELETDFKAAQESYTENPYKEHEEFKNEVFAFLFYEGYITPKYAKIEGTSKDDKSKIIGFEGVNNNITTKEQAIKFVYDDMTSSKLDILLQYSAAAQEINTEYTAKALEIVIRENMGEDGVDSIEGIVSVGHHTDRTSVTVNGNNYNVAQEHNENGTPKNEGEYDVLEITINGVDPKAVWNFAFSVAPQHYYGEGAETPVDIENHKYGVDFNSFDFMKNVVQTTRNNKLPMGAGAYKVTDRENSDSPTTTGFYSNNIVYFKANNNFATVGSGLNNAKIEKVRYQVVSASNAMDALKAGTVHYITPQLTKANYEDLESMKASGNYNYLLSDQLGYGYIGINAKEVPNMYLRRAIMCAMNTSLALDYYSAGTAEQIYWPMSKVSWAYPKGDAEKDNGKNYPQAGKFDEEIARELIQGYMDDAFAEGASESEMKLTFTIAGSNLQDHPTYKTFRDAAALLNDMGWDITVQPDTQALTKLSTGSLQVWAAAWGSTIDPDMYQVYHKNSKATSTLAWGYPSILTSGTEEEKSILDKLSEKIDEARTTLDQNKRTGIYEEAMTILLDLAVELPVYQRSSVYAYNTNVLDSSTLPSTINPYSSPLDRIWEIDFKN